MRVMIISAAVLMAHPAFSADSEAGQAKFQQLCASCHGDEGQGDGPAATGLKPPPRDFSDEEWQASVDDEHLRTVIEKGGMAAGLSPVMTPFGHALSDAELDNIIAYIRTLDE